MKISVGNKDLAKDITPDQVFESPRTHFFQERITEFGSIELDRAGEYVLRLSAEKINPEVQQGICVSEVMLEKK